MTQKITFIIEPTETIDHDRIIRYLDRNGLVVSQQHNSKTQKIQQYIRHHNLLTILFYHNYTYDQLYKKIKKKNKYKNKRQLHLDILTLKYRGYVTTTPNPTDKREVLIQIKT